MSDILPRVLTLAAAPKAGALLAADITRVRKALAAAGAAVGRVEWLNPSVAAALPFDTLGLRAAQKLAEGALEGKAVDAIATPFRLSPPRLFIADMDATIIAAESLDELAAEAGIKDEIAKITERAMRGEIDFPGALRARVGLLKGLDAKAIDRTLKRLRLTPGAKTLIHTLKAYGTRTVLVSGGFTCFAEPIAGRVGFERIVANRITIAKGKLAGTVAEPILDKTTKLTVLNEELKTGGIARKDSVAIGDGANDIPMLKRAGLGIAFRAKPATVKAADAHIRHGDLTTVLYALGIPASSFRR